MVDVFPNLPPTVVEPVIASATVVHVDGVVPGVPFWVEVSTEPSFITLESQTSPVVSAEGGLVAVGASGLVVGRFVRACADEPVHGVSCPPGVRIEQISRDQVQRVAPGVEPDARVGGAAVRIASVPPGCLATASQPGGWEGRAPAGPDGVAVVTASSPGLLLSDDTVTAWFEDPERRRESLRGAGRPRASSLPPLVHPAFNGREVMASGAPYTDVMVRHRVLRGGVPEHSALVIAQTDGEGIARIAPGTFARLGSTLDVEPQELPTDPTQPFFLGPYGKEEVVDGFWADLPQEASSPSHVLWRRGTRPRIPRIRGLVLAGHQTLWLDDVSRLPGSFLVTVRHREGDTSETWEARRPVHGRISLPRPLVLGEHVAILDQQAIEGADTYCDAGYPLEWVKVRRPPSELAIPEVLDTVLGIDPATETSIWGVAAGAGAVRLLRVVPGARVRLYQDGWFIGAGVGELGYGAEVVTLMPLLEGSSLQAEQELPDGRVSGRGAAIRVVRYPGDGDLPAGRIVQPLTIGNTEVRLSGIVPGAHVRLETEHGDRVAECRVAEAIATVTTLPVPDMPVRLIVTLGQRQFTSDFVTPRYSPGCSMHPGGMAQSYAVEFIHDFGMTSAWLYGPAGRELVQVPVKAEVTLPQGVFFGHEQVHPPLALLLHGTGAGGNSTIRDDFGCVLTLPGGGIHWDPFSNFHGGSPNVSALGFRYLARTLARQGFHVYSLDCSRRVDPNMFDLLERSKAAVLLSALNLIRRSPPPPVPQGTYEHSRIGLIGHSTGGEAVIHAETMIGTVSWDGPKPDVRGVVAFAPTTHRLALTERPASEFVVVYGTKDHFWEQPGSTFDPVWWFDSRETRRVMAFVPNGDHFIYNDVHHADNAVVPMRRNDQTLGREWATALMRSCLLGDSDAGYLLDKGAAPSALQPRAFVPHHRLSSSSVHQTLEDFGPGGPPTTLLEGSHVAWSGEGLLLPEFGSAHDSRRVTVGEAAWHGPTNRIRFISIQPPALSGSDRALVSVMSFSTLQLGERDGLLVVEDESGGRAGVRCGVVGTIPDYRRERRGMTTIGVFVDAFMVSNPALRADTIRVVGWWTEPSLLSNEHYCWDGPVPPNPFHPVHGRWGLLMRSAHQVVDTEGEGWWIDAVSWQHA